MKLQNIFNKETLGEKASQFFIKLSSTEHTFMVLTAVLIGLLGGFGAVGIQEAIKLFKNLFWGNPHEFTIEYIRSISWYWKILIPMGGSFVVGIVIQYFSKEAKGHGVPEVMEAIALRNGIIRPRVVIAKLFSSAVYIASGGSVGREGPVIQIGSSIGSAIGQFLKVNPQRLKIFVASGAASGIAAAFNAPVAGALFAVEVILGDFGVAQFSPIVIASVVSTVVSRHFIGDFPAFTVPSYELVSPFELVPYALVGLFAGIIAVMFIRTLYYFEDLFDEFKLPEYGKTVIGGFLIGIIGIFFPQIFGVGYSTINAALYGKMAWQLMGVLILVKIVATSLSLGSGGSGGVFAPSLFLGAMAGGFIGTFVHMWFPSISSSAGAYALVGMGAVVAGATHAPITAILIIFELTNDYKIILPLMIACIIATLLTGKLQKESIYTLKLVRRGIDIFKGREINLLRSISVKDAYSDKVTTVKVNAPLRTILTTVSDSDNNECFVIDDNEHLIGVIPIRNIRKSMMEEEYLSNFIIALDIMEEYLPTIVPEDDLDTVMRLFSRYELTELPVVKSKKDKKIVGIITRADIIDMYNKELLKRNMAQELVTSVKLLEKEKAVEFLPGTSIMQIPVSQYFVGKTLSELDFRKKFGVQILVIAKKDASGEKQLFPTPDYRLENGDRLVIMGNIQNLNKVKNI